jgi:hypothetical protein
MRGFSALCACSALCALAATSATAQSLFSTGFESPTYTTGQLVGQNNWANSGGNSSFVNVVTAPTTITGPGGTESVPAIDGSQMITTYTTKGDGSNYYYPGSFTTAWNNRTSGNNIIDASIDVYIPSVDSTLTAENGVALYTQDGLTDLTSVLFNNKNDTVIVNPSRGNSVTVSSAFARDTWVQLNLYANFNTQQVDVLLNHTDVASISGAFLTTNNPGYFDLYTNANLTTSTSNSYAVMDDYSVSAVNAVPGPNALPIFASGLVALTPWLRKSRRLRTARRSA